MYSIKTLEFVKYTQPMHKCDNIRLLLPHYIHIEITGSLK